MGINFDGNDIEKCVEKTKELASIFDGKEVYVKSLIKSDNGEEYTNYHSYQVKDIQFGPSYLYIYSSNSVDRIILKLENVIETDTTSNSFEIVREFCGCRQEFKITLV